MHGAMDVHWALHSLHQTCKTSAILGMKYTYTFVCAVQAHVGGATYAASIMPTTLSPTVYIHPFVQSREFLEGNT